MGTILFFTILVGLCTSVSAFSGLHSARHGLLQLPPSFAHDGINMYPALHPAHDSNDLRHLELEDSKQLYYSQEGHRPALHGAKHGELNATFSRPTVVLEHSKHIKEVNCKDNDHIEVCLGNHAALKTVENSWKQYVGSKKFNLVTYHQGCGHRNGEYRSFFIASNPVFEDHCVTVDAELTDEKDVIHGGELSWGTYRDPKLSKREITKGHVRIQQQDPADLFQETDLNGMPVPLVDLTQNGTAAKIFFGTDEIHTDIPDEYEIGLGYLSDEELGDLARRGLFSWIVEGISATLKAILGLLQRTVENIKTAVQIVVALAIINLKLLLVPFGVPFHQSYQADIDFDHRTDGKGFSTDLGSALGGTENNLVLSKEGAALQVKCESCGAKAKMSFDGALAFSISSGVTQAHVSFINHEDFIFDAIYGVTVDARVLKEGSGKKSLKTTIEKELIGIPFYAIKIPKIITIGPQVILNAAASVYLDAHGEFRAGARFKLAAGELTLDAMNSSRNVAHGFKPSVEPIFEIKQGNVVATADLALPVGVEAALDILGGTWKKAIGVYTAPSVYLTAGYSKNEGHACDNGVELRVGAKNRIYSSALGIWEYEFKELGLTFFETGLGCISSKGWDKDQVEPTNFFNDDIAAKFGGEDQLATNKTLQLNQPEPVIYDDEHFTEENKEAEEQKLRRLPAANGFRLIQDAQQSSTLVSGKDGYLYMVNNSAEYDISAPWGSLKVDENIFSYDVFGRLLYHNWQDSSRASMRDLHVTAAQHMPENGQALSVVLIKESDVEAYGVTFEVGEKFKRVRPALEPTMYSAGDDIPYDVRFVQPDDFWFPTVCQIKGRGLRLYATHYLVDKDGKARIRGEMPYGYSEDNLEWEYYEDRRNRRMGEDHTPGVVKPDVDSSEWLPGDSKICRTVRLVSDPRNATRA